MERKPSQPVLSAWTRFWLIITLLLVLLALGLSLWPRAASAGGLQAFETDTLTIVTGAGEHGFTVEIADTPARQAQGLMFRQTLAEDAGMLFVYPHEQAISMWMKNTLIPLDMLFIAGDGRIHSIAEGAVPHDLTPIRSDGPVRAVLEVPAGTAARLGVKPGDRVVHSTFEP